MNRKIIITKEESKIYTTIVEDNQVVELHCSEEMQKEQISLGNIYIGKVKKIVNNMNAAFIEIAPGLECYYPLDEKITPYFTNKLSKKTIAVGDELLVQISREPLKSKTYSLTAKVSISGQYCVVTYGDKRVGVSGKLDKNTRERFSSFAQSYVSEKYGIIVRTNAKDVAMEVVENEIKSLSNELEQILQLANTRTCFTCLKKSDPSYLNDLKNVYQEGLESIVVEDSELYKEILAYLTLNQPENIDKLSLYNDKLLSLHKLYKIDTHLKQALNEKVWLKSGAYLVIQPTEALTVIDVNTGKFTTKKKDELSQFKINIEAAKESARQIRLRNLSGIILIDFINLNNQELTDNLLKELRYYLRQDPVETTLVDMTKLHLVEITRKKIRKTLKETI